MPLGAQFGSFDPGRPDGESWGEYVERLGFFFIANATKENQRLGVLLSVVGTDTYRIIRSVVAPDKSESLSYSEVSQRMGVHFNPTPSHIVQRCRFHRRMQGADESITEYITQLRKLSEHCKFSDLNERLRDQMVAGVFDDKMQCRLLEQRDELSFDSALKIAISFETAKGDSAKLRRAVEKENNKTEEFKMFTNPTP